MKAFVQNGYGSADVYELVEVPKPEPAANELLVRVIATSINDWEWGILKMPWLIRSFLGRQQPRGRYRIMGCDFAGVVEAVGSGVSNYNTGDEVFGDLSGYRFGAFAEYVCVTEPNVRHKPGMLSFEQAAAVPHAGELAIQAIRANPLLCKGQSVLINGAGGGVGTLAIQMLKRRGVHVTGVDRSQKHSRLKELGYDELIAWPEQDFTNLEKRFDFVIDVKTDRSARAYLRALENGGVYATVGGDKVFSYMLLAPLASLFSSANLKTVMLKPNRNLAEISEMLASGVLEPVIGEVFEFSQLRVALTQFRKSQQVGKIVVRVSPE